MMPEIKLALHAPEREIRERCLISEVSNDAGDQALSVARARVLAGEATAWHRLRGIDERYLIISGRGRAEVEDLASAELGPGDVVRIPAGSRQRIVNLGLEDLIFYCLCTPRFREACYEHLE
jgi:mannose-6-phosphate isomerase-like protein (cupin superfamily)